MHRTARSLVTAFFREVSGVWFVFFPTQPTNDTYRDDMDRYMSNRVGEVNLFLSDFIAPV